MVYLLHFKEKLHRVQHYIGYTKDIEARMKHHRSGNGSCLLKALNKKGIKYDVVRTWDADGNFERKLKNRKKAYKLCPICNPKTWETNGVLKDDK